MVKKMLQNNLWNKLMRDLTAVVTIACVTYGIIKYDSNEEAQLKVQSSINTVLEKDFPNYNPNQLGIYVHKRNSDNCPGGIEFTVYNLKTKRSLGETYCLED